MDYIQNLRAEAKVNFTNEADKFELNAPKPAAAPPVRKSEPAPKVKAEAAAKPAETPATTEVKADANAPKPDVEAVKAASANEKTDKKVEKKADKKVTKKAKKKVDKKK